ncbi:hypothetical protein GCM10007890_36860 [Methylobacterium tardum]|uniref:Uncharacterized protein n=1 Tax=Methylobacterium tardum TaxID=374432 RepID=A0AA37TNQ8_9HYPH|nr:hypothetical protein GCM10007890_36860 [Methylobacterium tardum]
MLAQCIDAEALAAVDAEDAVGRTDGCPDRTTDNGPERTGHLLTALSSGPSAALQTLRMDGRSEAERRQERESDRDPHDVFSCFG